MLDSPILLQSSYVRGLDAAGVALFSRETHEVSSFIALGCHTLSSPLCVSARCGFESPPLQLPACIANAGVNSAR